MLFISHSKVCLIEIHLGHDLERRLIGRNFFCQLPIHPMGLSIFAGGHNFHGKYEYVPVESMLKAVEVIVKICELVAKRSY